MDENDKLKLSTDAFDAKRLAENEARLGELEGLRKDVEEQLAEVKASEPEASDEARSPRKMQDYELHNMEHLRLTKNIDQVQNAVNFDRTVMPDPSLKKKGEENQFSRFLLNGLEGLAGDELENQKDRRERYSMASHANRKMLNVPGASFFMKTPQALLPNRAKRNPISAIVTSDTASAQESVQDHIRPGVTDRLDAYGGLKNAVATISTVNGAPYNEPEADDSAQIGTWLNAQGATVPNLDTTNIKEGSTWNAWTLTSGVVKVSRESLVDVNFPLEGYIISHISRRLGLAMAKALVAGTGTAQPHGVVSTSHKGVTSALNTGPTWTEILTMEESINAAYLMGYEGDMGLMDPFRGYIGYVISRSMYFYLRKQVDSEGRPLFASSLAGPTQIFSKLFDKDYIIDHSMDAVAAGKIPLMFGNFGHYLCRMVEDIEIFRFWDSNTMTKNEIHIVAFMRLDGNSRGPHTTVSNVTACEAYKHLLVAT